MSAVAVAGVSYIGAQSKIKPYVIGVKNGEELVGVAPVSALPDAQLDALKIKELEHFVEDLRGVLSDASASERAIRRAYARMAPNSPAYHQVTAAFQAQSPFERATRELVKVEVRSVLPLSDNTWQVEWQETITERSGQQSRVELYRASVNTQTLAPQNRTQLLANPLGFWVNTFNDVQMN
ncbi:IncP-type conjugative transfer protein TrbF [Vibrio astriarenae]|nr:IncP-type conjugative transfer protein TrbF [Vibrio sp. C7]